MNLIKLDFASRNDSGVYFYDRCKVCEEIFFYRSRSFLKAIWEVELFKLDFKIHVLDCVNKNVMFKVEIYEKKN